MSKNIYLGRSLIALALASAAGMAQAAACVGSAAAGLDTSDMTYSPTGEAPFVDANKCFGVSGNDKTLAEINAAASDAGMGNGFVLADKTDAVGGPVSLFGGSFTFSITASGSKAGSYTLTATDNVVGAPDFPIYLDFIGVLKGGTTFAGWFFDDVLFDGSGGGSWEINFLNRGGNIPDLSHMSVYVREGTGGGDDDDNPVPEPGSLALVGLGLAAAGMVRRRRKAA